MEFLQLKLLERQGQLQISVSTYSKGSIVLHFCHASSAYAWLNCSKNDYSIQYVVLKWSADSRLPEIENVVDFILFILNDTNIDQVRYFNERIRCLTSSKQSEKIFIGSPIRS